MPLRARAFIAIFITATAVLNAVLLAVHVYQPSRFYFRSWEYTSDIVFTGWRRGPSTFMETGDSSRQYFRQRYAATNVVTVNDNGNRSQPTSDTGKSTVLFVGDSELWGSGVSDNETVPWLVQQQTGIPAYNASRRHELDMLRDPRMNIDAVVFSIVERNDLSSYCLDMPAVERDLDDGPRDPSSYLLPMHGAVPTWTQLKPIIHHLQGYVQADIARTYKLPSVGFTAPSNHLITERHLKTPEQRGRDLACAVRLNALFTAHGRRTAFFYFPAHQTIYGSDAGMRLDRDTAEFIPDMTRLFERAGLLSFDSKACLAAHRDEAVFQLHDTHVNALGQRRLAGCLIASSIGGLFR